MVDIWVLDPIAQPKGTHHSVGVVVPKVAPLFCMWFIFNNRIGFIFKSSIVSFSIRAQVVLHDTTCDVHVSYPTVQT